MEQFGLQGVESVVSQGTMTAIGTGLCIVPTVLQHSMRSSNLDISRDGKYCELSGILPTSKGQDLLC